MVNPRSEVPVSRQAVPRYRHMAAKLCAIAAVLFAIIVLRNWGVTPFTLFIAFTALCCPAVMIYGWWLSRRALAALDETPAHTHGMTMNSVAPIYDFYCPLLGLGETFRYETLRHADLRPGQHVLDVGCGTGVLTRLAALATGDQGETVGIDPSPAMLQVARRKASKEGSRAIFKVAAIESLPFENGRFDLVLSSFMLHHLPPAVKRAGMAEVYRVLKPGGCLLVVDIDKPANPLWWLLCWPLLIFHFTAPNLRGDVPAYLRAAGFTPVDVRARKGGLLSFWRAMKPSA